MRRHEGRAERIQRAAMFPEMPSPANVTGAANAGEDVFCGGRGGLSGGYAALFDTAAGSSVSRNPHMMVGRQCAIS